MARQVVLLDSSILIDFFRKKDKTKTSFYQLSDSFGEFSISSITEYEITCGATESQMNYWKEFLQRITILSFDSREVAKARFIYKELKKNRKQIAIADLFIAATAIANNLPLATLNKKHFESIEGLELV